jgi:hypothetical protein
MDTLSDLWDTLPLDDGIFNAPPAKADATVNIMSLPLEALELVTKYCTTRSIPSLMLTNRTLYPMALRKLYSTFYYYIRLNFFAKIRSRFQAHVRRQNQVASFLLIQQKYTALLRHFHIINFPWLGAEHIHENIELMLRPAVSLQTLTIAGCRSIPPEKYRRLLFPTSLKHISIPNLQTNLIEAIPSTACLRSLEITSKCASLDELQALGEKWGSSLRRLRCIVHIPRGEPDPSMERIDEFIPQFPHLDSLRYGYCGCSMNQEVSFLIFFEVM